jgi:hypothetical protein
MDSIRCDGEGVRLSAYRWVVPAGGDVDSIWHAMCAAVSLVNMSLAPVRVSGLVEVKSLELVADGRCAPERVVVCGWWRVSDAGDAGDPRHVAYSMCRAAASAEINIVVGGPGSVDTEEVVLRILWRGAGRLEPAVEKMGVRRISQPLDFGGFRLSAQALMGF